jgi:hypothetical protein
MVKGEKRDLRPDTCHSPHHSAVRTYYAQRFLPTIKVKFHGAICTIKRAEIISEIRRRDQLRWGERNGELVEAMSDNSNDPLMPATRTDSGPPWYPQTASPPDLDTAAHCFSSPTPPHMWTPPWPQKRLTIETSIFSTDTITAITTKEPHTTNAIAEEPHNQYVPSRAKTKQRWIIKSQLLHAPRSCKRRLLLWAHV